MTCVTDSFFLNYHLRLPDFYQIDESIVDFKDVGKNNCLSHFEMDFV